MILWFYDCWPSLSQEKTDYRAQSLCPAGTSLSPNHLSSLQTVKMKRRKGQSSTTWELYTHWEAIAFCFIFSWCNFFCRAWLSIQWLISPHFFSPCKSIVMWLNSFSGIHSCITNTDFLFPSTTVRTSLLTRRILRSNLKAHIALGNNQVHFPASSSKVRRNQPVPHAAWVPGISANHAAQGLLLNSSLCFYCIHFSWAPTAVKIIS